MNLDKNIISQIWDGCEKQIVDGYVYIKMDDLIKLETEEILNPTIKVKDIMNMDKVAAYLISKGWKYENNTHDQQIWHKKPTK
jgi:hypothetical protein